MKKIEKMIKDRPIAKKLSLIFQFILIAYLMLAAIGFVGMVQAKNYVGMAIIVVIVLVSIWFNNVRLQSVLSKTLVEPIKNLVVASEKISSGDFEIGLPEEAEDEENCQTALKQQQGFLIRLFLICIVLSDSFLMEILMYKAPVRMLM